MLFRLAVDGAAMGLAATYYLTRHNQFHKMMRLSFSVDMMFGIFWRGAAAFVVTDIVSRRMFVNYVAMKKHQMAENEIRKVMRQMPHAKPYVPAHKKPNSYFWV